MEEIKRRTLVAQGLTDGHCFTYYKATSIESTYLQFRKVLELIALASLVANKEHYAREQEKFANHWHAARILRDLAAINENFYPVPGKQIKDPRSGKVVAVDSIKEGYLTKDDFIELYESCGKILHADNPYGDITDLEKYEHDAPVWFDKIRTLLNHHQIQLVDSDVQIWCMMQAENDGGVHAFVMQRMEQPSTSRVY
jgi:hypothetical protein